MDEEIIQQDRFIATQLGLYFGCDSYVLSAKGGTTVTLSVKMLAIPRPITVSKKWFRKQLDDKSVLEVLHNVMIPDLYNLLCETKKQIIGNN